MATNKPSDAATSKDPNKQVVNMSKSKKGRVLPASTRAIVFSVLQFALREKQAKTPIMDIRKAMERTAAMTGLSRDTVLKIKKEGSTNGGLWETPTKRPRPKVKTILNDADKMVVLNKIDEFERRNEAISLRKLLIVLKQEINFAGGKDSLRRVLLAMGYKWEKNQSNKKVLRKGESQGQHHVPDPVNTSRKITPEDFPPDNTNSMPLCGIGDSSLDQMPMHRQLQNHGIPHGHHQGPLPGPHQHLQLQQQQHPHVNPEAAPGPFMQRPLLLHAPHYIFNL